MTTDTEARAREAFEKWAKDHTSGYVEIERAVWLAAIASIEGDAGWIKTSDRLPEKPGKERYEYVDCLIYYKGEVLKRPWNCEHLCWDDEQYDDFFAHPTGPTHWMLAPKAPTTARAEKEGEQSCR
jgi:hypothetical protein